MNMESLQIMQYLSYYHVQHSTHALGVKPLEQHGYVDKRGNIRWLNHCVFFSRGFHDFRS